MLKMKPYCRAKCVEHLDSAGIEAELVMDQRHQGKYMGWYYEQATNRYWMVRLFDDSTGKELMIARPFVGDAGTITNLPVDTSCLVR